MDLIGARHISLDDWTVSGGGAFSTSYFHKTDPSIMLKMMSGNQSEEGMLLERENAAKVYGLGLPTPKPGEVVTDGRRLGILFERMPGKRSYARAIGEEPGNIAGLGRSFAEVARQIHSTQCDTSSFPSLKELYAGQIRQNRHHDATLIRRALDFLESVPDATTCLHGDFHFGNVIISEGKSYIIDLNNFSYGNPMLDFGMIPSLLFFSKVEPARFLEDFHCTGDQATLFWHEFLKGYFGEGTDVLQKEKELLPYCVIRTLSIEIEAGILAPKGFEEILATL